MRSHVLLCHGAGVNMLKFFQTLNLAIDRHAPAILSVGAIGGFIAATVLAVRATPTAVDILDIQDDLGETPRERITNTIKLTFPLYAPSVAMTIMSASMVLGANHIFKNRYMSMSALYAVSQKSLENWQRRTLEVAGEKKYHEVVNRTATPDESPGAIIVSSGEGVLCYDVFSARYFKVDSVETIRRVINDTNANLFTELFVSLNDFYFDVGLPPVGNGDDVGWAVERGLVDIKLHAVLTPENKPCVSITFTVEPKHIYKG